MYLVGIDEVGRGPLAGPLITAAVILNPYKKIMGLNDSKLLSPKKREQLAKTIQANAIGWSIGRAEAIEIDQLNILQATLLAMQRAYLNLNITAQLALIDGPQLPNLGIASWGIINGDQLIPVISAASILAKVIRDEEMANWDVLYPQYGFAQHKGYGTLQHRKAVEQWGLTPLHRRSFMKNKYKYTR